MMFRDPSPCAGWRDAIRTRLAAVPVATAPDRAEVENVAAGAALFLEERAGARPVRDEDLDALLGESLCAIGRVDLAAALVGGAAGAAARWRDILAPSAPAALRRAALRRWLRPACGESRTGEVWILDLCRVTRDTPGHLELGRFRLLAAALDALAEGLPPERGLDALALRWPPVRRRRATARRAAAELRAFCAARLAEAARRRAWPRIPEIIQADLEG